MAEHDPQFDAIPHAVPAPPQQRYLTLVWLVPIVAALVAGWLGVQAFLRQGPTIRIAFVTADGLQPGITRLRYKDVEIGTVSAVTLSDDRSHVIVTARMQKQAGPLLREDTRFWVVRPRISASSVSGLGTLFSGAYIGVDAGTAGESRREFTGLEMPPVVIGGRPGRQFMLKSETLGSLDIGSPVYFRQVQVGQVVGFEIDPDGRGTSVNVFVNAPYDRFVSSGSRFWLASGIDARFDASGFQLNTESLVSVLVGGIAFSTPEKAPSPADAVSTSFRLFPNEASARREPDPVVLPVVMVFHESVRGLATGAPIDFRGIAIGEVRSIDFALDRTRQGAAIEVRAELYPERLVGKDRGTRSSEATGTDMLDRLVRRGLSAQLRQGNLITGQLYIALDVGVGTVTRRPANHDGVLLIPTAPGSFTELQTSITRIARKLEEFPLQDVAADARRTMRSLDRTLAGIDGLVRRTQSDVMPQIATTLETLRRSLASAQEALDADAPTQTELRTTLREVARAADAVRLLADALERQPEALLRGRREER